MVASFKIYIAGGAGERRQRTDEKSENRRLIQISDSRLGSDPQTISRRDSNKQAIIPRNETASAKREIARIEGN